MSHSKPGIPHVMRAVVAYAPEDFRLEEVAVPTPGPGELLVKVEACGICGSDVKAFKGAANYWGGPGIPKYMVTPCTIGHEFVGHVAAVGEGAAERHGVDVGDRVTADQIVPCRECWYCMHGKYWMCAVHNIFGWRNVVNGAWADYMIFPRNAIVHRVPDEPPIELAVLVEPVSCAVHAVERARIEFGDLVVISGTGSIGLAMVGLARLKGAGTVVAVDLSEERLAVARSFGAHVTLNPRLVDAVQAVRELSDGGIGCDVYIESSGSPKSVLQGLEMLRKLGRFVEFSVFGEPTTVDWSIIGNKKELDIYGSHLGPYSYPVAIDLMARGELRMDGVVTHFLPLERWHEALDLVIDGTRSIKVAIRP
jgi:threonine dehydrogenase-like Zn-dependent dehydrogenase